MNDAWAKWEGLHLLSGRSPIFRPADSLVGPARGTCIPVPSRWAPTPRPSSPGRAAGRTLGVGRGGK
jgi:hypothetical protein